MRSVEEIRFRLKQAVANVWLAIARPATSAEAPSPLPGLPDPRAVVEKLRGSMFAFEVERLAGEILQHRFAVLGYVIDAGREIAWRRDYIHKKVTPKRYFPGIPYLDFDRAGDHKIIWELNRHQHLVVLAQAWRLTGRREFLEEIQRQLRSWFNDNPFQRSINWTSALEVAFRALSWIWVYHLAGDQFDPHFRSQFLTEIYRHGLHLEYNLSIYFSPNTHLLGEAVALHAIGKLFPALPRAGKWRELGARIVEAQMERQVRDDGSHFEQSAYYHVYALDMFLFHAVVAGAASARYLARLRKMAEYLAALTGPAGRLLQFGDDDGGRFFHPYGARDRFARATLATCAAYFCEPGWCYPGQDFAEQADWWLGPQSLPGAEWRDTRSRWFPSAGVAVLRAGPLHAVVDAGPFAAGSGGHSHSDTLSLVVRRGDEDILIDPGTYTYVSDPKWRDWFRGSAGHSTIRIDGLDQGTAAGPFRWSTHPAVTAQDFELSAERDYLDASCAYSGFTHRRRVLRIGCDLLVIHDSVDGPPGEHIIEQFWHLGSREARHHIALTAAADLLQGAYDAWRSPVFGVKLSSFVLRVREGCTLPARFAAVIDLAESAGALSWSLDGDLLYQHPRRTLRIRFSEQGRPEVL